MPAAAKFLWKVQPVAPLLEWSPYVWMRPSFLRPLLGFCKLLIIKNSEDDIPVPPRLPPRLKSPAFWGMPYFTV